MLSNLKRAFDKFRDPKSTLSENILIGSLFIQLPEETLAVILSFLPDEDILQTCPKVCRLWKSIVESVSFWKLKCARLNRFVPPLHNWFPKYQFYMKIYFKNPYARNLILNPCGKDDLNHWEITQNGGDRWKVEKEPRGCKPFDIFTETHESFGPYCFATSYGACCRFQLIDLIKEGCDPNYLDIVQPKIEISEWHAARFDCGSIYRLEVKLINEMQDICAEYDSEDIREEQWIGKAWSQVKYIFKDYGPGARFIKFSDSGKDTQFWAGHYGSKMSGACVQFIFH